MRTVGEEMQEKRIAGAWERIQRQGHVFGLGHPPLANRVFNMLETRACCMSSRPSRGYRGGMRKGGNQIACCRSPRAINSEKL